MKEHANQKPTRDRSSIGYRRAQLIKLLVRFDSETRRTHDDLAAILLTRFCEALDDYLPATPRELPAARSDAQLAAFDVFRQQINALHERYCIDPTENRRGVRAAIGDAALSLEALFEAEDRMLRAA